MQRNGEGPIDDTSQLIEGLRDAGAYPHPCSEIDVIQTHISYVILTGELAYKIKKPVRLPFVDFSDLQVRRQSCDDELRLNRRLAKQLYLEVVPIGGTPQAPRVGATPAIEYAVAMVQFDPEQTLDKLLQRVAIGRTAIVELAAQVAAFHVALAPVEGQAPGETALSNLAALRDEFGSSDSQRLDAIGRWLTARAAALGENFRQRQSDGFVRECHGDLHLGNLVQIGERIQAFDCIEFSKSLRSIDTLDEVAFVFMDFLAHEAGHLGFEFLNRYLEHTGDYGGMQAFRFYVVHRALVRAYVRMLGAGGADRSGAQRYLDLAAALIEPNTPLLLITTGLSGSGKTTVTDALIARLPALRIRSDLVRKRLHGLQARERSGSGLGQGLYSSDVSDATYEALARFADTVLSLGFNVIVDAAFLQRERRAAFAELAKRHEARIVVLAVTANEPLLRARVRERFERGKDASEAGLDVLDYQVQRAEPVTRDEPGIVITVDTGRPVDADQLTAAITRIPPT